MFRHGLLRNTVQSAHMKRYTNSRDLTRENPFQGDQDYKNQLLLVNLFWSYKWQLHKKARVSYQYNAGCANTVHNGVVFCSFMVATRSIKEAVQKTFWKSESVHKDPVKL